MNKVLITVLLVGWLTFSDTFYQGLVAVLFPHLKQALFLSNFDIGLLFAAFFVSAIIAFPVGTLSDQNKHKQLLLIGIAFEITSLFLFPAAQNIYLLLIARFMHGLGSMIFWVSGFSLIAIQIKTSPKTEGTFLKTGQAMGIALSALGIGAVAGPVVGGILFEYFNYNAPFAFAALLFVPSIIVLAKIRMPIKKTVEPVPIASSHVLKERTIIISLILMFLGTVYLGVFQPFFSVYAVESLNFSIAMVGALLAFIMLVFAIALPMAGYFIDRGYSKAITVFGLYMAGIGTALIGFADSFWIFPLGMVIGIGLGCYYTPAFTNMIESKIGPVKQPASYGFRFSLLFIIASIGFSVGSVGAGMLQLIVSFETLALVLAGLLLSVGTSLFFIMSPAATN